MDFYSLHVAPRDTRAGEPELPDFVVLPETPSIFAGWVFGPFWFAYHGLYLAMICDAGMLFALAAMFKYFNFTKWGVFALLFAQRYLVSHFAHDLRRHHLDQNGYDERDSLFAEDMVMAEELALDALLGGAKPGSEKGSPPAPETPAATAPEHPRRRGPLAPFASPFESA